MDKIDTGGPFPAVLPCSLEESGVDSVGGEPRALVIETANMYWARPTKKAVHLVREYAQSYTKYPF